MHLTQWTDYTLRVLMYCAASQTREQPVTITEIADSYGISRSHLTKVVQDLAAKGLLKQPEQRRHTTFKLAGDINLGSVVRAPYGLMVETPRQNHAAFQVAA
jgi:Rrf2 family nitric oxide-sensitive transcriptional repressor